MPPMTPEALEKTVGKRIDGVERKLDLVETEIRKSGDLPPSVAKRLDALEKTVSQVGRELDGLKKAIAPIVKSFDVLKTLVKAHDTRIKVMEAAPGADTRAETKVATQKLTTMLAKQQDKFTEVKKAYEADSTLNRQKEAEYKKEFNKAAKRDAELNSTIEKLRQDLEKADQKALDDNRKEIERRIAKQQKDHDQRTEKHWGEMQKIMQKIDVDTRFAESAAQIKALQGQVAQALSQIARK